MTHHNLDVNPIPEGQALFINEPWLIDEYLFRYGPLKAEPDSEPDNIRVYLPLDLNRRAILRRLDHICSSYGNVDWRNESDFSSDVSQLIAQVEIYDQVWRARHPKLKGNRISVHSDEGVQLVREVLKKLEAVAENSFGDMFPFSTIEGGVQDFL